MNSGLKRTAFSINSSSPIRKYVTIKGENMDENDIKFIRRKDYKIIKELGSGACGKTLLLHDDIIEEKFVCKKFLPYVEKEKEELFKAFKREIKLLHMLYHENIVRVFNYYLYPEQFAGFILMEYVNGTDIENYLSKNPERINEIFIQTVNGFSHLQKNNILHRDIRPANLMVTEGGILKIIDFGFGKKIQASKDYNKSITLNWWCDIPAEFETGIYDFSTEIYFVGKLFEQIIIANSIESFKYTDCLASMCQHISQSRLQMFTDLERHIQSDQFFEIGFSDEEKEAYRKFADAICRCLSKISKNTKYQNDIEKIQKDLEAVSRVSMLEEYIPNISIVLRCIIDGAYYYSKRELMPVETLRDFIHLLKASPNEKKRIILSNLQNRFDSIERYSDHPTIPEDDLPF
jgi:eukaryotic-like serine/threonine-protein kinase